MLMLAVSYRFACVLMQAEHGQIVEQSAQHEAAVKSLQQDLHTAQAQVAR